MQFRAVNSSFQQYELQDSIHQLLGEIKLKPFFKADITLPGDKIYSLAPKGFWGTDHELTENDSVIMHVHFNWKGAIALTYTNGETYHIKRESLWHPHFVYYNSGGDELMVLKPDYQWLKFKTNYDIELNPEFSEIVNPFVMLTATAIVCINQLKVGAAAVGVH